MILGRFFAALFDTPARRRSLDERERRALELTGTGRMSEALHEFRAAHEAAPLADNALESFVRVLLAHGEHAEAIRAGEESAAAHPGDPVAVFALGLAYQAAHRYGEALRCHDEALARGMDGAAVHAGRGIALQNLGRFDEALEACDRALEHAPQDALARFHRSLVLLARGSYESAWSDYEARFASAAGAPRTGILPRWHGEPPAGRTLLVRGEQGLGDEIMFASCIPDLLEAGARCVLECNPALRALFARSFPQVRVYAAGAAIGEAADAEVAIGSLPQYFRGSLDAFPRHGGYLHADPARIEHWRDRLAGLGPGLKIGISWQGGTHASRGPLRTIPLETWLPLLRLQGARFVSLQYTPGAEDALDALRRTHGVEVAHWPEAIADYDETAALVSALDLTISVCTALVHLAGALGRPVWVMAPQNAEWRYGCAGSGMPWYPSARIYRQGTPGRWDDVVAAVAMDLAERAGVEALNNLAIALLEGGAEEAGERALRRALDLDPDLVSARENLAIVLMRRFDHDAAVEAWNAVLALDPARATARAALGFLAARALETQGDAAGAERVLEDLRGKTDAAEIDWQLALIALAHGNFLKGWPLYEARLERHDESPRRAYPFPPWDGRPMREGALLVMAEQGAGDEIMFASCYADAIARAGRCIVECDPRLQKLFARSFPAATVVGQRRPGLAADLAASTVITAQIHAGSLPGLFKTRAEDFSGAAYLRADPGRVDAWRERMRSAGARRPIGIAWSGGLSHTRRALRSVAVGAFAELLRAIEGAEFVSLQHDDDGTAASSIAAQSGKRVHRFDEAFADFDEMAALICGLDAVLTVCSSVVHLAGALGARTIVLAPRHAEWRYMREGSRMPWYGSVRLLRQRESGDWRPVFAEAAEILKS